MDPWAQFEKRIAHDSGLCGIFVSRIPTGCRIVRAGPRPKIQLVKTDFDFSAGVNGQSLYFDAKALLDNNFNFKSRVLSESKVHQFKRMLEARALGNSAGYLIWFYELRKITWAPINLVNAMISDGAKSLNPDTPGCRTQDDFIVIDLSKICFRPMISNT